MENRASLPTLPLGSTAISATRNEDASAKPLESGTLEALPVPVVLSTPGTTGIEIYGNLMATQFASNQTNPTDGLPNALALAAPGAKVTLDPLYRGTEHPTEFYYFGQNIVDRSYPYVTGGYVEDQRAASDVNFASNVISEDLRAAHYIAHRVDEAPAATEQYSTTNLNLGYFAGGAGSYSSGQETAATNLMSTTVIASKSIGQAVGGTHSKYGIGDFGGLYSYQNSWGGAINGDDEGHTGTANIMYEGGGPDGYTPLGTVTATGTETDTDKLQFLRFTIASLTDNIASWGCGRYVLRVKDPAGSDLSVASFTATAQSSPNSCYTTVTVQETLSTDQQSAVYGLSAPLTVPYNNDSMQEITTTITIEGGAVTPPAFVKGIACMTGLRRNERVLITNAPDPTTMDGITTQTITYNGRYESDGTASNPGTTGAYFFQDAGGTASGLGQCLARLAAYDKGIGRSSQCVPIVGAIGEHTLVVSGNSIQGQEGFPYFVEVLPVGGNVTLTRDSSGTVHVNSFDFGIYNLYLNSSIVVTSTADPSFDMSGITLDLSSMSYPSMILTAVTTPAPATMFAGVGRNVLKLYRGVEIIRVTDPTQPTDSLGSYIAMEPNSIPFEVGDMIESPTHYSTHLTGGNDNMLTSVPASNSGHTGRVISVSGPGGNSAYTALQLYNLNPPSMYLGTGGYASLPTAIAAGGNFATILSVGPGSQGNVSIISVASLIKDSTTPTATATIWASDTKTGLVKLVVDQLYDNMTFYYQSPLGNPSFTMRPYGFTFQGGPVTVSSQQVKQVATATDATDAPNLGQVQSLISAAVTGYTGTIVVSSSLSLVVENGLIMSVTT